MKAVGYTQSLPATSDDSLVDFDTPVPEPGPRDLVVKIEAISINPVDTKIRRNVTPPAGTPPRILGWDAAGTVVATGSQATLFQPGDAVFYAGALDRPGTNSEMHIVDERLVGRMPQSLSFTQAAALPLTALTAWELLFDRLRVPYSKAQNSALLVIGGAGGVGSILIQLARRMTNLTVIATASRPETVEWVGDMGAHHIIDHRRPLTEGLREIGIPEVRYVAGLTATDQHFPAIVEALAPQGALALIDDPASLDIVPLKRKSLSVHWELMFTRSLFGTPDMVRQHEALNEVADLVDAGTLRSTFHHDLGTINATNLREAHRAIESGSSIGKITLTGF